MIDCHCHIIPEVDDGCATFDEALSMIREGVSFGIKTFICTPHHHHRRYRTPKDEIIAKFNELKEKVKEANIDVGLKLGMEIYWSEKEDIINMLKNGELLTLNNTKYVLLEFDYYREPYDIDEIIYNLQIEGFEPIIAHVERYEWMDEKLVTSLKQSGVKISVNSGSLLGNGSFHEKRFTNKLLKKGLVDIVASDMHSFRRGGYEKLTDKIIEKFNPEFLL